MTHPEELLAGYVDGTLSAKDRAAVDAHLAECARCRRETALAADARSALRSLGEEPAPAGVASRALEEAGVRSLSTAGGRTPPWYRIGGAVAAIAAGLLVFTLVLPHIGQDGSSSGGAALGKDSGAARESSPNTALSAQSQIEIRHVNFDNASLTQLTSSYQSDAPAPGGFGATATAAATFGSQAQTDKALACVTKSAPDEAGDIQSLIRARFTGRAAYLVVFFEGPGAGQPDDTVAVWVFSTADCAILSYSSAQL